MFAMPPAPPITMSATTRVPRPRSSDPVVVDPGDSPSPTQGPVRPVVPVVAPATPFGPDVSNWSNFVNWPIVAAPQPRSIGGVRQVSFAFTKATEGTWVDPTLAANWSGMRAARLVRGAYDFANFKKNPVSDARFYVRAMTRAGGLGKTGDFAVLDAESVTKGSKRMTVKWIKRWTAEVRRLTGYKPSRIVIYTGAWWWKPHTGNSKAFAKLGYRLWLSGYSGNAPSLPGWKWSWWQYTDRGQVPGVVGGSDASVWRGTVESLRAASRA